MRKRNWIIACAAGIGCLLLLRALAYLFDWIPRTQRVDLTMYACELRQNGTVAERFTLEVDGKFHNYRIRTDTLDAEIKTPELSSYTFFGFKDSPYIQQQAFYEKLGAFVSTTFGAYAQGSKSTFFSFALDLDKGCMIIREIRDADDPDRERPWIVASTDPSMTPQEILEHFDWFLLQV